MRLLLDTHLMLWWQTADRRLSDGARSLIERADAVFFSRASLWELAIKVSLGRLTADLPAFCARVTAYGFYWLEIREAHLLEVSAMPTDPEHRDPFDRLLVAQSRTEPLLLLTADSVLVRYGEHVRLV